jgi:hypothetical protein
MIAVDVLVAVMAIVTALFALTPLVDAHRHAVLRRIVPGVCGVLNAHGIDYWCDFGTLLGLYRCRDIIRGDKDADLSIPACETPRLMALAPALHAAGYDLSDRAGSARNVIRVFDRRTRYYVDVYPYVRDGAMLRSVVASPHEDIPADLVAQRVDAEFLGAIVRVPADIEAVLRYRYGSRFTTPRRGDKGIARRYSVARSVLEDLQDNVLGIWAWLR